MADETNFRFERISKLFKELEYEITRGMMEGEIDETLGFDFYVPVSKNLPEGVVSCHFRSRPILRYAMPLEASLGGRLKVIKGGRDGS